MTPVYKIVSRAEWADAKARGRFDGAAIDLSDGYIHMSAPDQLAETASKHFAGRDDLMLVTLDADALDDVRWEPSRGGALFPHLYGPLDPALALAERPFSVGADGRCDLPEIGA